MFNKLVQEFGLSPEYLQQEFSRRTKLFIELYKRNIIDYREVQKIINAYYTQKNKRNIVFEKIYGDGHAAEFICKKIIETFDV